MRQTISQCMAHDVCQIYVPFARTECNWGEIIFINWFVSLKYNRGVCTIIATTQRDSSFFGKIKRNIYLPVYLSMYLYEPEPYPCGNETTIIDLYSQPSYTPHLVICTFMKWGVFIVPLTNLIVVTTSPVTKFNLWCPQITTENWLFFTYLLQCMNCEISLLELSTLEIVRFPWYVYTARRVSKREEGEKRCLWHLIVSVSILQDQPTAKSTCKICGVFT